MHPGQDTSRVQDETQKKNNTRVSPERKRGYFSMTSSKFARISSRLQGDFRFKKMERKGEERISPRKELVENPKHTNEAQTPAMQQKKAKSNF